MSDSPARRPVRLLPEEVANQIAAGEVVERPASVLKELVENALDAGARRVEVEALAGGRRLIRVVDDGLGMSPDDLLLALERHATSKVSTADDLTGVHTLGFRGEALPSIAAVSRLRLRSRAAEYEAGSEVYLVGGVVREVKEVGCPVGTLVEVRDLFFNTPARRKFLKSAATEGAHLAEALLRLALARPGVAFRYQAGGRLVWDLPPTAQLEVRVAALLGRRTAAEMVPISVEKGPLRISGLAGLPSLTRSGPERLYLFVNGRYVRDRLLLHAVAEAYRGLIPAERRPVVVLHLELDPSLVDVNVHPAKVEVRFHRAGEIHHALAQGLRQGLAEAAPRPAAPAWPAPAPQRETPPEAPRPELYSRSGSAAAAATQGAASVRSGG